LWDAALSRTHDGADRLEKQALADIDAGRAERLDPDKL
jgi:hypothetical protein